MNVQFEEDTFGIPSTPLPQEVSGLPGLLIKIGIAKNIFVANAFLVSISVALVALTLFIYFYTGSPKPIGPQAEDFYAAGKNYVPGIPLH